MLGKILDLYFMPTIVVLAAATGVYSLASDDFWLSYKLDRELYITLVFLVLLILIIFAKYIGRESKKWFEKNITQWDGGEKEKLLFLD